MALTRAEYEATIDRFGVPVTFRQAKAPHVIRAIDHAGIATPKGDEALANGLGVGSKVITVKASDLPNLAPEKFDRLDTPVERLVIDSVAPVHEPATGLVIGWRCLIKGRT